MNKSSSNERNNLALELSWIANLPKNIQILNELRKQTMMFKVKINQPPDHHQWNKEEVNGEMLEEAKLGKEQELQEPEKSEKRSSGKQLSEKL